MNFALRARRATAIGVALAVAAAALTFSPLTAPAAQAATNQSQAASVLSKINSARVAANRPKLKANGYMQRAVDQYIRNYALKGSSYATANQTYSIPTGFTKVDEAGYYTTNYKDSKAPTKLASLLKSVGASASYNYGAVGYYKLNSKTTYAYIIVANYTTAPNNLQTLSTPTITGNAAYNSTMTAKAASSSSGATLSYEWKSGSTVIGTSKTLKVTDLALVGTNITVKVTATKAGYDTVTKTSKNYKFTKGKFASKDPVVVGTRKVGRTLKTTVNWAPASAGASYNYQWLRNGKVISGATKSSYLQTKADKKKKISVKVTASAPNYYTVSDKSVSKKKTKK